MDQTKIGVFLKNLRKEKGLTQEEVAEKFYVSRRTVTRWETGNNMPDLDILVNIADFYDVDLRELFDGERKSERMNEELEETVKKAAEYSNIEKAKATKMVLVYLVLGLIGIATNLLLRIFCDAETFWAGFAEGTSIGLALVAIIMGILYATGRLNKLFNAKRKLLKK